MTAHAMTGDRERCLAAGMDSYISKPIRSQDLFETISQVVTDARPARPVEPITQGVDALGLDWSVALETVGGDRQLLREIIEAFLDEAPRLLAELREGAEGGDLESLRRAAHTLKASLRYLGAAALADQAYELESCGREGRVPEALEIMPRFNDSLEYLLAQLPRWVGTFS